VTTIKPENLMFPNTMTDIDHDTIMLSGSSIMSVSNFLVFLFNLVYYLL